MEVTHLSDTQFSSLELDDALIQGLTTAGYEHCTPIQAQSLPHLLNGNDVAGQAKTGTGKTIAFLVAVIQRLLSNPASEHRRANQPRALIIAPTRELAIQIHKDAVALVQHTGLKLGLVYGGANYEKQRNELKEGVDILIGTPGRVIDYFKQKVFDLRAAQAMVLDEADRMFDLGFIKDIRFLLRRMPHPEKRLNMLFSATLSHRVMELAYEHMNNPVLVKVESESITADKIEQGAYYTANDEKIPLLLGLIEKLKPERSIIFVNTKRAGEKVWGYLEGNGLQAGLLSGDIPQKKRQRLLELFQKGELPILVATDVAARGLHIPAISHVFNFDLPQIAEDYVHRIGRTARAGASGVAISFACEDYAFHLPEIEEYINEKIESLTVKSELLVEPKPPVRLKSTKPKPHGKSGPGGNRSAPGKPRNRRRPAKKPSES
ncbi:ATP-dependent RNA helicase RhlB [Pseudomonadota bacterium]